MVEDPMADLFQHDAGDDEAVKAQDIDELKVKKDQKARIVCLLPDHRKALIHEYSDGESWKRHYCMKHAGAKCCEYDKDAAWPYWFNIVFSYILQPNGKPALPIQGRVQFIRFKRQKYIDFREKLAKVREEMDDESIRLDMFDLDIDLDGEEDYQKWKMTHNMSSILVRFAIIELRKEIIEGRLEANDLIPQESVDAVKKEDEEAKVSADPNKFKKKTSFSIDALKKYAPVFRPIMDEVEEILKKVPKYWRFANVLNAKEIEELWTGPKDGEAAEVKPADMGVSESDMSDLLT